MGGEDGWLWWEFGHLLRVPDPDDVKRKNKNHETIPSRFSLNRQQRSLLFYVICVQYTRFWPEFRSHCLLNCQFIWSGKCTFDCHDQSRNFKNYASGNHVSTSSCMLRIEKLTTFNMTCSWTFHNSLLRSIVMITFIILMNCTLKTLLHVISISVIMFTPYCYLQTISCQVWKHSYCCSSLNNIIYFFLQLPAFTCCFHRSIISYHFIHSLLLTHFTNSEL